MTGTLLCTQFLTGRKKGKSQVIDRELVDLIR